MSTSTVSTRLTGVRLIALLELAKGGLVLLAGFGILTLLHRDAGLAAERLVQHLHVNPASGTPRIFIELASGLTDARLLLLAAGAAGYACVRAVEAYGLWRERTWAEWFGAVSGAVYLPLEVYELSERVTWERGAVFVVNVLVVGVLALALWRRKGSGRPR
ncbi:MAG: DUF2127 domain-containing protein [Desulfovibrio sp.]|nr:DUF2127 domain-containing protein [Desulfovibrio sp.]